MGASDSFSYFRYAIKELNLGSMSAKERQDALNEVRVLASLDSNPNSIRYLLSNRRTTQILKILIPVLLVSRYYDAFLENDKLMIVTEFARGGDLSAKIKRNLDRKERIDEEVIWRYFIQICQGLQSLHASNVIHRDIKSANIYLLDAKHVAIGDFGISKVLKCSTAMATTQIGTPYYMAPEIWSNQRYNEKCDVWALGVLLYEMAALRHPFLGATERSLRDRVLRGQYEPLPPCYSAPLRDMVRLLLAVDPRHRPCMDQVLACPAVASRLAAADI